MKRLLGMVLTLLLLTLSVQAADLRISTDNLAIPGEWSDISVSAVGVADPIESFSLCLALSQSKYAVVDITPGAEIVTSDWEYFTYRLIRQDSIPEYDLRGASHLLTVTAFAGEGGAVPSGSNMRLLDLKMLLDYETTGPWASVSCTFQPMRFYWRNCTDNVLYSSGGETVLAAANAFDDDLPQDPLTTTGFRPPEGPCAELEPATYLQSIDAFNGGVDFLCVDSLSDGRGDINLNGRPFEIADVIVYNCVLLYGLVCLDVNPDWQIIQSDVNRDGYPLTVGDMVYMLRLMTHEIMPAKLTGITPPEADLFMERIGVNQRLVLSSDQAVAGVYIKLARNGLTDLADVSSLNSDLLQIGHIGDTTTLLLIDTETGDRMLPAGTSYLAELEGSGWEIVEAEAVTESGAQFSLSQSTTVPTSPFLLRNYPNPFNPTTTIVFDLSHQADWVVSIYDVTGRAVQTFNGTGQGHLSIDWNGASHNGSAVSSGVYFYRLEAGGQSESRKMLLLK